MRDVASHEELERLVGRALLDPDFASRLVKDPASAADSIGISLTTGQVSRITGLDAKALSRIASDFQKRIEIGDDQRPLW